ncbi:MAG: extracellular solute-binding protein [Lachnospiraceae bacterium]|nr:extracellular solute-binding protein [Lachnospiraceae bacterium]
MKKKKTAWVMVFSVAMILSGCADEKKPESTTQGASESTTENAKPGTSESTTQSTTENTIESTAAERKAVRINEKQFPDEIFRDYVRNKFDENEDDILSKEEILQATEVDVDYTDVKSLKGIENLSELTVLSCKGTDLEELDVSANRELQTLRCVGNALSSLDVTNNTKLGTLEVNEGVEVSGAGENVRITKYSSEEAEKENDLRLIRQDDYIIGDIYKACCATLADEIFYTDAEDTVVVTVNPKGEIEVSGFSSQGENFIKEIKMAVFGESDSVNYFRSKGYREGGNTTLTYSFSHALYTWIADVKNDISGSRYCNEDDPNVVPETKTPHETGGKTRIEVMAFTSEVPNMFKKYVQTHPDFAAEYELFYTIVTTDNGAYQSALDQVLMDTDEYTPDIYMAESAFVKKYTTGSASSYACTYEDLGIDVEQKIRDAGIASYIADVTRRDGKVVGLSYEGDGCAFIYNREVAKDVFGDDKPETVEAAIGSDWDTFFEAAEKCKQKGYAIVSGPLDIWNAVENSADHGWVVDGKLYIDPKREAFMDLALKLKQNDYTNDTRPWNEGWFADMEEIGPKRVLGFYGPSWLINYTLFDHCGYQLDDYGNVQNLGTYGQWAACRPNVASFWGGTWLIANRKVLQDEKLKAGVRELIEYVTLDTSETGLQYQWANGTFSDDSYYGYIDYGRIIKPAVASRVVMEKSNGCMDILGGQDVYPVFIETASMARGDNLTEYDELIGVYWKDAVNSYITGECTRDEAIRWFKNMLRDFGYFAVD